MKVREPPPEGMNEEYKALYRRINDLSTEEWRAALIELNEKWDVDIVLPPIVPDQKGAKAIKPVGWGRKNKTAEQQIEAAKKEGILE